MYENYHFQSFVEQCGYNANISQGIAVMNNKMMMISQTVSEHFSKW